MTPLATQLLGWPEMVFADHHLLFEGHFGFDGPLRQYFSLYRSVFQSGRKEKRNDRREKKKSKQDPPAPTASEIGPCSTILSKLVGRPGTES